MRPTHLDRAVVGDFVLQLHLDQVTFAVGSVRRLCVDRSVVDAVSHLLCGRAHFVLQLHV